jgi:CRP/FNR family cyclic AMP-dependent transcriptional regulator
MKRPASKTAKRKAPAKTARRTGSPETEEGIIRAQKLRPLIEEQSFFKGLKPHYHQLLAESALELYFEAGETIFKEGGPANRFYLILEGKVVLEVEAEVPGLVIPLVTLGPGDDLGWSWLFPPHSLHASARAVTPTRTIFFYGPRLREQAEEDHELGYELLKRSAQVMANHLWTMQQRLLEYADLKKLGSL